MKIWAARSRNDSERVMVPGRRSSQLIARATPAALCGLLVLALVLSVAGITSRSSATQAAPSVSAGDVSPAGFAEMFVAHYLAAGSGQEDTLRTWFSDAPELRGVKANQRYVARTGVLAVNAVAPGYWSVTVAADVLATGGPQVADLGTHAFRVGVFDDHGRFVATGLPSEIQLPVGGRAPRTQFGDLRPPASEPELKDSMGGFLAAYLAGSGELDRYISPGVPLSAVQPAPCARVEVSGLAVSPTTTTPTGRVVLARVSCIDGQGRSLTLDYAVRLAQRDGRWEVAELLPAVPLGSATAPTAVQGKEKQ